MITTDLDWRKIMLVALEAMSECCGCNPLGIRAEAVLRERLTSDEYEAYVKAVESDE